MTASQRGLVPVEPGAVTLGLRSLARSVAVSARLPGERLHPSRDFFDRIHLRAMAMADTLSKGHRSGEASANRQSAAATREST